MHTLLPMNATGETTKTAHEPKRHRLKRPINFQNDQNGPAIHPKRPITKSKTAYEPKRLTVIKKLHSVFSLPSFFYRVQG